MLAMCRLPPGTTAHALGKAKAETGGREEADRGAERVCITEGFEHENDGWLREGAHRASFPKLALLVKDKLNRCRVRWPIGNLIWKGITAAKASPSFQARIRRALIDPTYSPG